MVTCFRMLLRKEDGLTRETLFSFSEYTSSTDVLAFSLHSNAFPQVHHNSAIKLYLGLLDGLLAYPWIWMNENGNLEFRSSFHVGLPYKKVLPAIHLTSNFCPVPRDVRDEGASARADTRYTLLMLTQAGQ